MSRVRSNLVIQGRVQGVFFRQSALEEAVRLGLTGWVRNREDGAVEAVAEGEPEQLEAFLRWCRHGPPSARVDAVAATPAAATGEFEGFQVRR